MAEIWTLVPAGAVVTGRIVVEGEEASHLVRVRRRTVGTWLVVADGAGARGRGRVVEVDRHSVVIEVESVEHEAAPPGPGLTLAMSVLHGSAMDLTVQKAVELGARRLWPVVSARTQLSADAAARRRRHWQRVARQALKQCRRLHEMEVLTCCGLTEIVAERGERRGAVADPTGCAVTTIETAHTELLLVGPEGGFDEVESRVLDEAGWSRLYLGPHLLRAETAAVAGLTVLGLERERRGL